MNPAPETAAPPRKADAFLVSCIDPRLTDDTTFLMAALGRSGRYSEMRIAGAALAAVDESRPAWRTTLWETLDATRSLHGVRKVIFLNHRDCGAMALHAGRNLAADPADELRQHHAVLERAAAAVRARHPDMAVELKLMDLDGSVQTLPCAACAGAGGLRAEAVADPATNPEPPRSDPAGFADRVRLHTEAGLLEPEAERALLTEGVTQHGLSAADARAVLDAESQRRGAATASGGAREAGAFLRAQADPKGRVSRQDADRAAALYRALTGRQASGAEAARRIAAMLETEGLAPRPEGLLRSTTWHRRMLQG